MRDLPEEAARILRVEPVLALATTDPSGRPASTPVFFVAEHEDEGTALYWLSSPDSRHSRDVEETGRAAGSVWPGGQAWQDIRGVQLEGSAARVEDAAVRARALARYGEKHRLPPELAPALAASTLYALRPSWLRLVDNRVAFGHHEERGRR